MKNRAEMLAVVRDAIPNPRVAEVGVYRGHFSRQILDALQPSLLLLVDPWMKFPAHVYADYPELDMAKWDGIYQAVSQRFGGLPGVSIVRATSVEAAASVPDDSLDFAYIDANHSYESVREDLLTWLPKVRPGGFIGGHDVDQPQVRRAVDEVLGPGVPMTTGGGIKNYLTRFR